MVGRVNTSWRRVALELSWDDLLPTADLSIDSPIVHADGGTTTIEERVAAPGPAPDEAAITRQQRIYLDRLAERAALSKQQTAILRMRYVEDYTRGEIVEKLGISKQACSAYEKRALEKLRRAVEESDPRWPSAGA